MPGFSAFENEAGSANENKTCQLTRLSTRYIMNSKQGHSRVLFFNDGRGVNPRTDMNAGIAAFSAD